MKIFTSNVLQKTKDSVYLLYCLLINLSNNQTNEKDLIYKVRVSYRMYPYLFHTTSRESKKCLFGTRHTVFLRTCPDRYKGDIQGKKRYTHTK